MDPMFSTAALASAEKIINAALAYDPSSRIAFEKLAPQVLGITLKTPDIRFYLAPTTQGVRLLGHCDADIATQIEGTPAALLSLVKSGQLNVKDSGVQIFGNTGFLVELQRIIKNMDIDWEEMLSQVFGDILGHQGAETIRSKFSWTKDRAATVRRLTGEFLTEELHLLPGKPELAFFNTQVDDIKLGVDRIEARIEHLLARIKRPGAQQE